MTDLSSLISLVEKATGPDRELDRLIHFHVEAPWLAEKCAKWTPAAFEGPNDFLWWTSERLAEGKEGYHDGWESYTSSVDSVLVLIGEKLPGWSGVVDFGHDSPMRRADMYGPVKEMGEDEYGNPVEIRDYWEGEAPTPAIALVLATLLALQSKGPET